MKTSVILFSAFSTIFATQCEPCLKQEPLNISQEVTFGAMSCLSDANLSLKDYIPCFMSAFSQDGVEADEFDFESFDRSLLSSYKIGDSRSKLTKDFGFTVTTFH